MDDFDQLFLIFSVEIFVSEIHLDAHVEFHSQEQRVLDFGPDVRRRQVIEEPSQRIVNLFCVVRHAVLRLCIFLDELFAQSADLKWVTKWIDHNLMVDLGG